MALTALQAVRLEIQDNTPGLYIISDDEVTYFLEKHNGSIARASLDVAKSILFNLSQRGDETVDILSLKGSKAAESYKQALMFYIKDQTLNPINQNLSGWVGGISKSEMQANDSTLDNNYIKVPSQSEQLYRVDAFNL